MHRGSDPGTMVKEELTQDEDIGTAGPEIGAERAERKRFEEARRLRQIPDRVRTKIDKSK